MQYTLTEASQGARSVWAGQSLEAQNLCSGLCCVSVEVASGHTGTLERLVETGIATPPIPSGHVFCLYTPARHAPAPWHHSARGSSHSGVASVLGRSPADSSQGRPRSSVTRPQHEPSPQTLGTPPAGPSLPPPAGPSLPPLMYSSFPGCLAMEPRLPDLASVCLGEEWGAGLLEPLRRERLASGAGWPWIPFAPWAGVRDGPHSQRERAPCWGIAQTEGPQGRR